VNFGTEVLFGQIGMPSMMHGRFGIGQISAGSVGSGARVVEVSSPV
jgi:hypothetical protein